MSEHERSDFRDKWISDRHRAWGKDAPMVDIDWLVCEYDNREPVALVDYKCYRPDKRAYRNANYRAFERLGDRASLPAFVVYYWPDTDAFRVESVNARARALIPGERVFNEHDYVEWLYGLRERPMPAAIAARLSTTPPAFPPASTAAVALMRPCRGCGTWLLPDYPSDYCDQPLCITSRVPGWEGRDRHGAWVTGA